MISQLTGWRDWAAFVRAARSRHSMGLGGNQDLCTFPPQSPSLQLQFWIFKLNIWNLIWTFGSSNDHIWETKKKLQLAQKFWSCWWFPSTKSNLAAFFHFSGIFAKETILSGCPEYHGEGLFRKWSEYAQGPFYASLSIGTFELSHVLKNQNSNKVQNSSRLPQNGEVWRVVNPIWTYPQIKWFRP